MTRRADRPSPGIRAQVAVPALLVALLVMATTGAALWATASQTGDLHEAVGRHHVLAQRGRDMQNAGADASAAVRALGEGTVARASAVASYEMAVAEWESAHAAARRVVGPRSVEAGLLDSQEVAWRLWRREQADPLLAGTGAPAGAAAPTLPVALTQSQTRLVDGATARVGELERSAERRQRVVVAVLLALSSLAVLTCLVSVRRTMRGLVRPLEALQVAVGRLAAGHSESRAPTEGPAEVAALAHSINVLAQEGERLRHLEETRTGVRRLARELDRRMREHLHPEAVADEGVVGLAPAVSADRALVRLVGDEQTGPVVAQWSHPAVGEVEVGTPTPADHPLESYAVVSALSQPVVVPDVENDPLTRDLDPEDPMVRGLGSVVLCPLVAGHHVIGLLECGRRKGGRPWSASEVGLVEAVAADMARAIHHARLFAQQSEIVHQLRELDRSKSDFLSTVSHELRTPLTSISGYLEMLRDGEAGELEPMQRQMVDVVARNATRLRDLIEDLLTISRVESGAVRSERLPVAVDVLVENASVTMLPTAEQAGVVVDVVPSPTALFVLGDPGQLERVVLNVLGNAVKFTPRGGRVEVATRSAGDEVVVTVTDTGIGIPAVDQRALFTRFFRAGNAQERSIPGTGLGLAICQSIVAAHAGRIEVESTEGVGTCITITLPALDPASLVDAPAVVGSRRH